MPFLFNEADMTKRKYSDETIFEVRRLLATGATQAAIQAQLGMPQATVSKINTFRLVPTAEMPKPIPTALELFHMGNDYIAIGQFLHISEAEVERQIHAERSVEIKKATRRSQRRAYQKRWNDRYREEMNALRGCA